MKPNTAFFGVSSLQFYALLKYMVYNKLVFLEYLTLVTDAYPALDKSWFKVSWVPVKVVEKSIIKCVDRYLWSIQMETEKYIALGCDI